MLTKLFTSYSFKFSSVQKLIQPKKVIIIGGVAGGASCAARLRRLDEQMKITILEKGPYVSYANCGLPYYIGGIIQHKQSLLLHNPKSFKDRFNIDVKINHEVKTINRSKQQIEIYDSQKKKTYSDTYDKLVISPGAEPFRPPIPGYTSESKRIVTLRNVPDTEYIKELCDKGNPKHVVIVGAGFIGLEMAECLQHRGIAVTVIELLPQVMPPLDFEMASIIHQHLKYNQVQLFLKDGVKEFKESKYGVVSVLNSGYKLESDFVLLSIGVRPDTKLAKEIGLKVERGIIVNSKMQTSDPNIYAVGDAVEVKDIVNGDNALYPLAGPANKQGRIAADQICGRHSVYKGSQGTGIAKVFALTVAVTGNNAKTLQAKKIPYKEIWDHPDNHAGYYPGVRQLATKLIFCPNTGRILGGQVIGASGADKRLDVLATAVRQKMTVFDLEELELAYAPPFSSAKDPINYLGFIGANMMKGDIKFVSYYEIDELKKQGAFLLDVRRKDEYDIAHIPGSVNIPLYDIRTNLNKIPKDKKIITICVAGLRGYIGARILMQNGFKEVYDLSGGFKTWHFANTKQDNTNIFKKNYSNYKIFDEIPECLLNANYAFTDKIYMNYSPKCKSNRP